MLKSDYVVLSPTMYRLEDLPDFKPDLDVLGLIRIRYSPRKFYLQARDEFYQALRDDDLRSHIQKLAEAGDMAVNSNWENSIESFKAVKSARKLSEALRCIMMFVDVACKQPKVLKQFNDSVGDFKDQVVHDHSNKNPADAYKALDRILDKGLPNFDSASYDLFLKRYNDLLDEICQFYYADDLTLRQHHKLRVRVRTFCYLYKTVGTCIGSDELLNLADYLGIVASEMGKTQDRIYVLKLKGVVDEEVDRTCLNLVHRVIIGNFLRLHGK